MSNRRPLEALAGNDRGAEGPIWSRYACPPYAFSRRSSPRSPPLLVAAAPAPARTVAATAWKVDLGAAQQVSAVTVLAARARGRYRVQTSLDGRRFRTAARVRARARQAGAGRSSSATARFVRLDGKRPARARADVRRRAGGRRPKPPPATGPAARPPRRSGARRARAWRAGVAARAAAAPRPAPSATCPSAGPTPTRAPRRRPWGSIQRALELRQAGRADPRARRHLLAARRVGRDLGGDGRQRRSSPRRRARPGAPITLQPLPRRAGHDRRLRQPPARRVVPHDGLRHRRRERAGRRRGRQPRQHVDRRAAPRRALLQRDPQLPAGQGRHAHGHPALLRHRHRADRQPDPPHRHARRSTTTAST